MPNLTIQIVTFNSAAHLTPTLEALAKVPANEAMIRIIDNASADTTLELVRGILPQADVIRLQKNIGFAGGHNVGFQQTTTPFVLVLNPDAVLNWEGVKKLLPVFDDPKVAAVQGKLWRTKNNRVIDSAGIVMTRALNGVERGAGESDDGQYESVTDIAAVSGACGLYRTAAVKTLGGFDADFFAYKEDVDLGWRLKRAGWRCVYQPVLMGYHGRSLRREGLFSWGVNPKRVYQRLKDARTRYSLRNWVWMVAKNATWQEELKAELFIAPRLLVFFVFSVLYPPLFGVWGEIIHSLPRMLAKRKQPLTV